MGKILVTSYVSPDLDGYACIYAYTELLRNKGEDVVSGIFGNPHREVNFVLDTFSIDHLKKVKGVSYKGVILVDASDVRTSKSIKPNNVIEIIDHRKVHDANKFPNANVQIELVGAAATLVAERFYVSKTNPSSHAAVLLYSAIVSNTINFRSKVTTSRDHKMAKWLMKFFSLPKNYIQDMFSYKSTFTKPLKDIFEEDWARSIFNGKSVSIFQLEILEVNKFIDLRKTEIKNLLVEIKSREQVDIIFLTCIDVFEFNNTFVVVDDLSTRAISQTLEVKFQDGIARREGIIMRKEIVPLIKAYLENNS